MRSCSVAGCDRPLSALGFCIVHYRRRKRGTPLDAPIAAPRRRGVRPKCSTKSCRRPMHARRLCLPEYLAARRRGAFAGG